MEGPYLGLGFFHRPGVFQEALYQGSPEPLGGVVDVSKRTPMDR